MCASWPSQPQTSGDDGLMPTSPDRAESAFASRGARGSSWGGPTVVPGSAGLLPRSGLAVAGGLGGLVPPDLASAPPSGSATVSALPCLWGSCRDRRRRFARRGGVTRGSLSGRRGRHFDTRARLVHRCPAHAYSGSGAAAGTGFCPWSRLAPASGRAFTRKRVPARVRAPRSGAIAARLLMARRLPAIPLARHLGVLAPSRANASGTAGRPAILVLPVSTRRSRAPRHNWPVRASHSIHWVGFLLTRRYGSRGGAAPTGLYAPWCGRQATPGSPPIATAGMHVSYRAVALTTDGVDGHCFLGSSVAVLPRVPRSGSCVHGLLFGSSDPGSHPSCFCLGVRLLAPYPQIGSLAARAGARPLGPQLVTESAFP